MRHETEAKIIDDFRNIRNIFDFLKHEDYLEVVPTMPNKDKVYEFLANHDLKTAKALIRLHKMKNPDLMPIRNLRILSEQLGIDTWKTDSPETLRAKVHERLSSEIQQTTK